MKCVGIKNGIKKADNSEYCWLYYTDTQVGVEGVITDKAFFRKHLDIAVNDEFEFEFRKNAEGRYFPIGVKILDK